MRIFFPSLFFLLLFFFTRIHKRIHRLYRVCVCRIRIYKYTYSHIAHGCNTRYGCTHALTHAHVHRSSYLFKILREFVHKASHDIVSLLTYGRDNDERRDTRSSTIYLSVPASRRLGKYVYRGEFRISDDYRNDAG